MTMAELEESGLEVLDIPLEPLHAIEARYLRDQAADLGRVPGIGRN